MLYYPRLKSLAIVLLVLAASHWVQAMTIAYTIVATDTTNTDPGQHDERTLQVISEDHWFSLTEGASRRIYDYSDNQIYYINLAARTFTRVPLSSIAMGRSRIHTANPSKSTTEQVWFDHRCGISSPGAQVAFQSVTADQARAWLFEGASLFSSSTLFTRASPNHLDNFTKILLNDYGLHPQFQDWLRSRTGLPQWVALDYKVPEDQHWRIHLRDLRSIPAVTFSLKGLAFNEDGPPHTPVSRLLYRLYQEKHVLNQSAREVAATHATKSIKSGHSLEAALNLYEWEEMSPDTIAEDTSAYARIKPDQYSELFLQLRAIASQNGLLESEPFNRTLNALDRLTIKAGDKGYVLDIIRGRLYARSRQPGSYAQDCFIRALQGNPLLPRVYFDLGRTLLRDHPDASLAWIAYEQGARLAPTLPESILFKKESDHLQREVPQFFKQTVPVSKE